MKTFKKIGDNKINVELRRAKDSPENMTVHMKIETKDNEYEDIFNIHFPDARAINAVFILQFILSDESYVSLHGVCQSYRDRIISVRLLRRHW